jgi:hypothetical protein
VVLVVMSVITLCLSWQPIIVVHEPNEGSRLEVKNALSKLPYMNRNPAV